MCIYGFESTSLHYVPNSLKLKNLNQREPNILQIFQLVSFG